MWCGFGFECVCVCVQESMEEMSQHRLAVAMYKTASLMNHSCDPNTVLSYRFVYVRVCEPVFSCVLVCEPVWVLLCVLVCAVFPCLIRSCVVVWCSKRRLIVRASSDIAAGNEIFNCYTARRGHMLIAERKVLRFVSCGFCCLCFLLVFVFLFSCCV